MPHLLIVDDEVAFTEALALYFRREGYAVTTAYTAAEARAAYRRVDADAVLLDVRLPDGSGLEVLDGFEAAHPPVLVLTAYGDVPLAVDSMQRGACDFLTKPVELSALGTAVRRALDLDAARRASRASAPQSLDEVERAHIAVTLREHDGNRTHTARALGISRATLIKKIRDYGLGGTDDLA